MAAIFFFNKVADLLIATQSVNQNCQFPPSLYEHFSGRSISLSVKCQVRIQFNFTCRVKHAQVKFIRKLISFLHQTSSHSWILSFFEKKWQSFTLMPSYSITINICDIYELGIFFFFITLSLPIIYSQNNYVNYNRKVINQNMICKWLWHIVKPQIIL